MLPFLFNLGVFCFLYDLFLLCFLSFFLLSNTSCFLFERFPKNLIISSMNNWHTGSLGLWPLDSRRWTLDAGRWTLGSGHWTLSLTVLEQKQKPVSDSAWLNYWKFFGCESLTISWSLLFYREYRFWRGYF